MLFRMLSHLLLGKLNGIRSQITGLKLKCIWYNVLDVVLGLVKTAVNTGSSTDERVSALLVGRELAVGRMSINSELRMTEI